MIYYRGGLDMANSNDSSLYVHRTPRISNFMPTSPDRLAGISYAEKYSVLPTP